MFRYGIIRGLATKAGTSATAEPKITARQKIEIAQKSFSDIFEGYFTNEETFEKINSKPIFENPRKFLELSQFHRQQVIEECEKLMKRDWKNISIETKRLTYFIAYGNWGARDDLADNLNSTQPPEDLPFVLPSKIRLVDPKPDDKVHLLPPIDLTQVSEKRRAYWKNSMKTFDPFTRVIIYITATVALVALYQDKYGEYEELNVEESPLLQDSEINNIVVPLNEHQEEQNQEKKKSKKWYYLWLK